MNKLSKILNENILENNPSGVTNVTATDNWNDSCSATIPNLRLSNQDNLIFLSLFWAAIFLMMQLQFSKFKWDRMNWNRRHVMYENEKESCSYDNEAKGFIYKSALIMQQQISQSPSLDCVWPPTKKWFPDFFFIFLTVV